MKYFSGIFEIINYYESEKGILKYLFFETTSYHFILSKNVYKLPEKTPDKLTLGQNTYSSQNEYTEMS